MEEEFKTPKFEFIQVGTPAFDELIENVRLQVRLTTEREMRQKDRWLTTEQACGVMGNIAPKTLLVKRKEPKSLIQTNGKSGKEVRYLESSLNSYLESGK